MRSTVAAVAARNRAFALAGGTRAALAVAGASAATRSSVSSSPLSRTPPARRSSIIARPLAEAATAARWLGVCSRRPTRSRSSACVGNKVAQALASWLSRGWLSERQSAHASRRLELRKIIRLALAGHIGLLFSSLQRELRLEEAVALLDLA